MDKSGCEHLDDYLLGWLSQHEAAAFEGHLRDCDECRAELESQRRIDAAFQQARERPRPVPRSLLDRVHRRVRAVRRWRTARMAGGLAVAAVLVALVAHDWFPAGRSDVRPRPERIVQSQPPRPAVLAAVEGPLVRMTDPSSAILVPLPSGNPEVKIVWVYPTVRPASEAGENSNP